MVFRMHFIIFVANLLEPRLTNIHQTIFTIFILTIFIVTIFIVTIFIVTILIVSILIVSIVSIIILGLSSIIDGFVISLGMNQIVLILVRNVELDQLVLLVNKVLVLLMELYKYILLITLLTYKLHEHLIVDIPNHRLLRNTFHTIQSLLDPHIRFDPKKLVFLKHKQSAFFLFQLFNQSVISISFHFHTIVATTIHFQNISF